MVLLVWLAKPVLYLIAFIVAARSFGKYGPHGNLPTWLRVAFATLGRLALGAAVGGAMMALSENPRVIFPVLFVAGLAFWFVITRMAFGKTPNRNLIVFATVAEVVTIVIDVLAWRELQTIRFC